MFRKVKRYAKDPYYAIGSDLIKMHPRWMSDKYYIKVLWRILMGYQLDLRNPKSFNEKLQWLKLYDHNPLYSTMVDKYRVKKFVADLIGVDYVIPTLAVYQSVDEIDLSALPDQFVLKCNHDSGSVVICRDKSSFDFEKAKQKLNAGLQRNFYWEAREWAYKHVKPLLFAEKYMEDATNKDLLTYKFLCFGGEPAIMYVTVKNDDIWENYYDMDFQPLGISRGFHQSSTCIEKPKSFETMKQVARKLSENLTHIRIDLYEVGGQVYFSEFTFYDWAGLAKFNPSKWDEELGAKVVLSTR